VQPENVLSDRELLEDGQAALAGTGEGEREHPPF
jgi:hypothetical protein